jgi:hypothetical protein
MTRIVTTKCDSCKTVIDTSESPPMPHGVYVHHDKVQKRVWELCESCVLKADRLLVEAIGAGRVEAYEPDLGDILKELTKPGALRRKRQKASSDIH